MNKSEEKTLLLKSANIAICIECGRTIKVKRAFNGTAWATEDGDCLFCTKAKPNQIPEFCCHPCYVKLYMENCKGCGALKQKKAVCGICAVGGIQKFKELSVKALSDLVTTDDDTT
jgi:hypothetical protein